jgi:DNA-binding cell septation regulator SpoVG
MKTKDYVKNLDYLIEKLDSVPEEDQDKPINQELREEIVNGIFNEFFKNFHKQASK